MKSHLLPQFVPQIHSPRARSSWPCMFPTAFKSNCLQPNLIFKNRWVHSLECQSGGLFSVGVGTGLVSQPAGPEGVQGLAVAE